MSTKSPMELAAEALLAAGGDRFEAGETITLPSGTSMRVLAGWAAVLDRRVLCTGRLGPATLPRAESAVRWNDGGCDPVADVRRAMESTQQQLFLQNQPEARAAQAHREQLLGERLARLPRPEMTPHVLGCGWWDDAPCTCPPLPAGAPARPT